MQNGSSKVRLVWLVYIPVNKYEPVSGIEVFLGNNKTKN